MVDSIAELEEPLSPFACFYTAWGLAYSLPIRLASLIPLR